MGKTKKIISSLLMVTALQTATFADEYSFDVDSLVGFEGGYSSFDVEQRTAGAAAVIDKYDVAEAGIKIGAQTKDFRVFISARNYFADDYDYIMTYGIEFQYLFNFSKSANFFIGASGGVIDGRIQLDEESSSRDITDSFVGADIGLNYHVNKTFDLELGVRAIKTDAESTLTGGPTLVFDNIVSGYGSIIVKFQLD